MLPPFETEEVPSSARFMGVNKLYRPIVEFLEQEGAMGLCMILAVHIISTGMLMFLGGFLLAAPLWALNFIPKHAYASIAIQLGTLTSYLFAVLLLPFPLISPKSILRRKFPGCQAAMITLLAWEILVIRWFCVEDDRTSTMSRFLCEPVVRGLLFLVAGVMIVWAGVLTYRSWRAGGAWPPRLAILGVLGEIFVLQEFYRNGGRFTYALSSRFMVVDSIL
ncbi:hypothetical protein CPB86DRAFT_202490 [Serendipita vermifera]|nr:hypothetical protein CPB86DRAFT_202490 [Serendipita vermifera]